MSDELSDGQLSVRAMFDEGRRLLEESGDYPSNSKESQTCVKKGTKLLEGTTEAVSALDMFSRNEDLKEIPVENIRFLSLPYYLGLLTLKAEWKDTQDRLDLLNAAKVYFDDFLDRCESYGIPTGAPLKSPGESNLEKLTAERQARLNRLREIRALEAKTGELLASEGEGSLKYWMAGIQKQCLEARDELNMIDQERPIVEHRLKLGEKGEKEKEEPKPRRSAFKPVILCRDEAQKKVYGLGYPSVPTLTVNEFYEKRVKEGWYQCGMKKAEEEMKPSETEIVKAERLDREEDTHDEAALRKARNWDEFKDDNPRGWGNRHNKG